VRIQTIVGLLALGMVLPLAPASAQTPADDAIAAMQGELATQVLEGCRDELITYCSEVTPGEGRLLACLYAHGDKLSGSCQYQLYDASARLERAISTVTYVAAQCGTEIEAYCANVEPGEGRMAQCLRDHRSSLSPGCDKALTDVGVP
jgi:Cysteine rich repeat